MNERRRLRRATLAIVFLVAGCGSPASPAPGTNPRAALFYTKAGSLYVSEPAGTPGRKLTDRPADAEPAPAPDLSAVAFVRKESASDYGGELWVLDLNADLTPAGEPRLLVDPSELPRGSGTEPPMIGHPRWSPAGDKIAFLDNPTRGGVYGGILLVADADTGELAPRPRAASEPASAWTPFAAPNFAWSPDGNRIAWLDQRSDVRPDNVNELTVGGESTRVVTGVNALSVAYAKDGRTILFTNGDTSSIPAGRNPFTVRDGGLYSAVSGQTGVPTALFTRRGSAYDAVAALDAGAAAFTAQPAHTDAPSKTIQILDQGSSVPRTTVTDVTAGSVCQTTPTGGGVCRAAQPPAWGADDRVAYLDTSPEGWLVTTDLDNRNPKRVDTGVDSFAWPPTG